MAHKKAGGSSRNGRDSAGRRLGVSFMAAKPLFRGILSCVSAAISSGQGKALDKAKIIQFLQQPKAQSNFTKASRAAHSFLCSL